MTVSEGSLTAQRGRFLDCLHDAKARMITARGGPRESSSEVPGSSVDGEGGAGSQGGVSESTVDRIEAGHDCRMRPSARSSSRSVSASRKAENSSPPQRRDAAARGETVIMEVFGDISSDASVDPGPLKSGEGADGHGQEQARARTRHRLFIVKLVS